MSTPSLYPYFLATRPKTLPASISPVIVGTALAWEKGVDPFLFFSITLFALLIQIGTNIANDYFDFKQGGDTYERKGPLRVTAAGLLSENRVKTAFIIVFLLALVASMYPIFHGGGPLFFFLAILAVACGLFYTATRYSIAYLGLGELFVFLFFGPIAVCGSYFLYRQEISSLSLLLGCTVGLLEMAILLVNNLRDVDEDRKTEKKTIIVRFGPSLGKRLYIGAYLFAYLLPFITLFTGLANLSLFSIFFVLPYAFKNLTLLSQEEHFNLLLARTAKHLLFYTLLLGLGLVFS